jgi:hypothetical protein
VVELRRQQLRATAIFRAVDERAPGRLHGIENFGAHTSRYLTLLFGLACLAWLAISPAAAADGWKFEPDSRDNPILNYAENGKTVFSIGCGRAFGLEAKYPGVSRKEGRATIAIANSKTSMRFDGEFDIPENDGGMDFIQWDLGFRRQDPELYGKRWNRIKTRLLDLIGSGEPLTVSAERRSYKIPPVAVSGWRAPFKACGG